MCSMEKQSLHEVLEIAKENWYQRSQEGCWLTFKTTKQRQENHCLHRTSLAMPGENCLYFVLLCWWTLCFCFCCFSFGFGFFG